MRKHVRIMAWIMAVIMIGNLALSAVAVTPGATSNLIYQESFELGQSMTADSSYNGIPQQTTTTTEIWNGATPVAESGIVATWGNDYGPATLEAGVTDAFHGDSCIKITPDTTEGGKMVLNVTVGAQGLEMTNGWYVASVMYKADSNVNYSALLRVKHRQADDRNPVLSVVPTGKWQKLEVVFYYDQNKSNGSTNGEVTLEIGINGKKQKGGSIYLDDLQIVKKVDATGVSISQDALTLAAEESAALSAVLTPAEATSSITWSSSDPAVATVDAAGKVTAVSAGRATITATATVLQDVYQTKETKAVYTDTCVIDVTGPGQTQPTVLIDDSFENFTPNNISNTWSDTKPTGIWNGATPTAQIAGVLNQASVMLEANVGGAADGDYCLKITPASSGGRLNIHYSFDQNVKDALKDGQEYSLKVWLKSEGTLDYRVTVRPVLISSGNPANTVAPTGNWMEYEYRFVYNYTEGGMHSDMRLELGMNKVGTTGSVYIDKVTLTEVKEIDSIEFDRDSQYLQQGSTADLSYTILPASMQQYEVIFSSSNEAVATVDETGKVTAVAKGDAVITVTSVCDGKKDTIQIHVVDQLVEVTGITVPETLALNPGAMMKLQAQIMPENATDSTVRWSSSDPEVVSVDADGVLQTWKAGTATITAMSGNGMTDTCTVTVTDASAFAGVTLTERVRFGNAEQIELPLEGTYTIWNTPKKGQAYIENGKLIYTSYTWLMEADGAFVDQEYTDCLWISVKNSAGQTALIQVNITIGKLEELFYDNGAWISDVDLLFSDEVLQQVRQELKDPTSLRYELLQNLIAQTDAALEDVPVEYTKPAEGATTSYDTNTRTTGDKTVNYLMAYLLTKDLEGYEAQNQKYLEKTIEFVKGSLSYPFWGTLGYQNNDLAGGQQLFSVAMVYHWLKEELQDVTCDHTMGTDGTDWNTVVTYEDQPILEAMEMRLWQAGTDMYTRNYNYQVYIMNHLHIRMGGLMAAATALRDAADTPEEKQMLIDWTGMALYKAGRGMSLMMPDGTSQEGIGYWEYGTEWLMKTALTARNAMGIDLFELTGAFANSGEYLLYCMLPRDTWTNGGNGSIINIGDSNTSHFSGCSDILRIIAAEYDNGLAQWLAKQVEDKKIDPVNGSIWLSVIFADPQVQPEEPEAQALKWFKDMDIVVSRSDWSGNEDMLIIKTGPALGHSLMQKAWEGEDLGNPDAGHAHPDANHISLYANGEYLLRDDGYMDKFTGNHSTLLINGTGQLGEGGDWFQEGEQIANGASPFIELAISNAEYGYDYIVGDATNAYAAATGLTEFERNLVYLKEEKVLLVVDNINTLSNAVLELRWFPASKTVVQYTGMYRIKGEKNDMNFYPFTKTGVSTAFEAVDVYTETAKVSENAMVQKFGGTSWQNAVAFSWNEQGTAPESVSYLAGENGQHRFEVNGKIYTIDVINKTVSVASGTLGTEDLYDRSDSSVTSVLLNGSTWTDFNSAVTEYDLDQFWKTKELSVEAYPTSPNATVTVDWNNEVPGAITITCTSEDGTSTTVYTIRVTNSQNILGIAGAESTVLREGYELSWTYDANIIAGTTGRGFWTVQGLPKVTYDLGEISKLTQMDITFHLTKNRDTYFDLLVSTDGINWTTVVADGVVTATKTQEPDLNHVNATVLQNVSIPARYVQIACRGNGSNKDVATAWCGIQEITIYGKNLCDVAVGQTTGGTVTADKEAAAPGDLVTLVVTPDQGKMLDTISVMIGNTPVTLTKNPNGTYSFLQPDGDVTISVTFMDAEESSDTGDLAPVEILLATMVMCGLAVLTLTQIKKRFF